MSLVKWKNIKWYIVKEASWPAKLGWPIVMYKSDWAADSQDPRIRLYKKETQFERPVVELKLFKKTEGIRVISCNPTITEPASLRPVLSFVWYGWFWFWKD